MTNILDRLTINPAIRSGKPTIRGTRITVTDILEYLAGGMTPEEILGSVDVHPNSQAYFRRDLT